MLHRVQGKTVFELDTPAAFPPWARFAGVAVAAGIAYFLAARLSLALLTRPDGVAVFWPAAGVSSGLLIGLGRTSRMPVVVATMAATIVANMLGDRNLASAIVFAACNAGEAVLVAAAVDRFSGSSNPLLRLRRVVGLLAAVLLGTAVSGFGGTLGYIWFHKSTATALTIWHHWFASDAIGVIAVAPLVIGLVSAARFRPPRRETAEGAAALTVLVALCGLSVVPATTAWARELAIASLIPLLLWVSARCRPVFAAAVTFIVALAILWTTTFSTGIFSDPRIPEAERILSAQAEILAFSLCGLFLAALFAERRKDMESLAQSEVRLQDALRAGKVTAFDWEAGSGRSQRSQNAASILGFDPQQTFTGTQFLERVHPDDRAAFKASVRGVDPTNPSYSVTFRHVQPDGKEMWLEETAKGEFDVGGRLVRISGLTLDITARKRVEQELATARKAAEFADRAKSAFLAAASHDLRQPLQTVKLLQATLARCVEDREAHRLLAIIGQSLETMTDMLNSLLDINRLESGIVSPTTSDFPINEVFDALEADFAEAVKAKGLRWRLVRSAVTIRSDQRMLKEMIRNLLSNALRFTERGAILVGCRRAGGSVRIQVWDSGIGIMGEHLPHIFEEHYQGTSGEQLGGFGLGLAIVQRLAKLLDHKIDVRSAPGKGSVFSTDVPMARDVPDAERRHNAPAKEPLASFHGTILLIEDDSFVRGGLDALLRSYGIHAVLAATGNEAVALVTKKGVRPDLVVTDYNLPGSMNGTASVKALRSVLARKIPAIVLTGDIRSQVIDAISKYDVSIAIKPLRAEEFLRLLGEVHAGSIARPG
ncbi:MAG TPA: MASE1 domain-containing protein [Xanthobacteraceae bacterium]